MPVVLPKSRTPNLWWPDSLCQPNPQAVLFYVVENLNCDMILSWCDMKFLGLEIFLQGGKKVSYNTSTYTQQYDVEDQANLVQPLPPSVSQPPVKSFVVDNQYVDGVRKKVKPDGHGRDMYLGRRHTSTIQNLKDCFALSSVWFTRMKQHLGFTVTLDAMATYANRKCSRYVSQFGEAQNYHTDIFSIPYKKIRNHRVFFNPPFTLLPKVVSFAITNRLNCVVLAPKWPQFAWFQLLEKVSSAQFLLPTSTISKIFSDGVGMQYSYV